MIRLDEDALICDLAETYNIYDYKKLPITKVAIFANGLNDNSRIKLRMAGTKVGIDRLILGGILDRLSMLVYFNTKDAQKNKNRPKMITESLTEDKHTEEVKGFISSKEFEKYRQRIIKVVNNGN